MKRLFLVCIQLFIGIVLCQAAKTLDDVDRSVAWPKHHFEMRGPKDMKIIQETDSMLHAEREDFVLFVYVEDRTLVSEEEAGLFLVEKALNMGCDMNSIKNLKYNMDPVNKKWFGTYFYLHRAPEGNDQLMCLVCGIDRSTRNLFTVIIYSSLEYEDVMAEIASSVGVN